VSILPTRLCLLRLINSTALVSPKDLKQACAFLPGASNPPIRLRTFKSGLTVLHTPYFEEANFVKRLQSSLNTTSGEEEVPGLANMEIARLEGISMTLTQQMLDTLEERPCAPFVRDDGDLREGTRWQLNYFEQLEKEWNVAGSWSR
jgi:ESCRT-II complex subunit VPS36